MDDRHDARGPTDWTLDGGLPGRIPRPVAAIRYSCRAHRRDRSAHFLAESRVGASAPQTRPTTLISRGGLATGDRIPDHVPGPGFSRHTDLRPTVTRRSGPGLTGSVCGLRLWHAASGA